MRGGRPLHLGPRGSKAWQEQRPAQETDHEPALPLQTEPHQVKDSCCPENSPALCSADPSLVQTVATTPQRGCLDNLGLHSADYVVACKQPQTTSPQLPSLSHKLVHMESMVNVQGRARGIFTIPAMTHYITGGLVQGPRSTLGHPALITIVTLQTSITITTPHQLLHRSTLWPDPQLICRIHPTSCLWSQAQTAGESTPDESAWYVLEPIQCPRHAAATGGTSMTGGVMPKVIGSVACFCCLCLTEVRQTSKKPLAQVGIPSLAIMLQCLSVFQLIACMIMCAWYCLTDTST